MAQFIDIHSNMKGVTQEELDEAHRRDHELQSDEGVHFVKAWADSRTGKVFCLSEGPNKEAVKRVHQNAGHPVDEIYEIDLTVE